MKLQDETLAIIANVGHTLRHAKKLTLQELAPYRCTARSEPYELVTRKGAPVSPAAKLLIDELLHRRS